MKKNHGIAATADGTYVHIIAAKSSSGWKITRTKQWQIGNTLRNSLFMGSNLLLGLESHWIYHLPSESEQLATSSESSLLSPCIHDSQIALHTKMLEKNLTGIYPDDAFLCTLPLHFAKEPADSFISIFKDEHVFRVGITIKKKLCAVFTLPSLLFAQLNGFLERIRRYLSKLSSEIVFPSVVYVFNNQEIFTGEPYTVSNIQLPVSVSSEIKALGVALCSLEPVVPSFRGPTAASRLIKMRSVVNYISFSLLLLVTLFTGYIYYQNFTTTKNLSQCESDYKSILDNNSEIRDLTKSGESLAKKLLRIEKIAANPTRWSKFLELIGNNRPPKLYFERLGSESRPGETQIAKIALSGWADSETTVTDLIQKLNSTNFVTNVTLSTLERDKKSNNTRFKILCNVHLSEN